MQKFEDAERLLQRSIWLDATSTGPYILMGKVLEKNGEYDLAVRALQRAARMDSNNPMTHQLLGQVYRDVGKRDEAESELKIVEQIECEIRITSVDQSLGSSSDSGSLFATAD